MGCRLTTAFRGLADRARLAPGEWLAVHGCGGVGLSAVMIASGRLDPGRMIARRIPLSAAGAALAEMNGYGAAGVTVITNLAG
jgi:alcohol dehydrogenase